MRTEAQIWDDFEKLGYKIFDSDRKKPIKGSLTLWSYPHVITIYAFSKIYLKYDYVIKEKLGEFYPELFTNEEYKLLHELFECWGWL